MTTIIVGSGNPAKVNEVKRYLCDLPVVFTAKSDSDLGITIDETAETFEGNVRAKLEGFSSATKLPVMAADGGMEIPALNNWPGVRTRRMGSDERKTDDEMVAILQEKINALPEDKRQFCIVDVWGFMVPGSKPILARGELEGVLLAEPDARYEPGFPLRKFWWIPKFNKHFYDLTESEHDEVNHHKQALDRLRPAIEEYLEVNHA